MRRQKLRATTIPPGLCWAEGLEANFNRLQAAPRRFPKFDSDLKEDKAAKEREVRAAWHDWLTEFQVCAIYVILEGDMSCQGEGGGSIEESCGQSVSFDPWQSWNSCNPISPLADTSHKGTHRTAGASKVRHEGSKGAQLTLAAFTRPGHVCQAVHRCSERESQAHGQCTEDK